VVDRSFHLWGIVNATPDSFSDGDPNGHAEDFIARALGLVDDGADVIDVGGESSRAGADPVSVEEELSRVLPVLEGIGARCSVPISIDTRRAEVADRALAAGASIVNDICGLRGSDAMADVVARRGARVVAMHWRPEVYGGKNVLDDVKELWSESLAIASAAGIAPERVILDPGLGVGFRKTVEQNFHILKHLPDLLAAFPSCEILLAVSRKSFLGTVTGDQNPRDRDCGSAAAAYGAYIAGVRHFRVHNVALSAKILSLAEATDGAI
jgi:dihydropteroate synthase